MATYQGKTQCHHVCWSPRKWENYHLHEGETTYMYCKLIAIFFLLHLGESITQMNCYCVSIFLPLSLSLFPSPSLPSSPLPLPLSLPPALSLLLFFSTLSLASLLPFFPLLFLLSLLPILFWYCSWPITIRRRVGKRV